MWSRNMMKRGWRGVGGHQEARKFEPAGRAPWSGGRPRGPTRGLGDAASIALALDGEDLGVMDDAIDERGGRGSVGEDRRPLAERQVGGEHEALALVAAADDLKEEVGGARVVGQVADLVDDEEAALAVVVQPAGQAARRLLTAEVEEELGGGGEEHVVAGEHRGVRDVLGEHRRAEALGRDEDDIAGLGKEVKAQGGLAARSLDARDRKSTRLNSSHANISYAVFC